jgi:UDP-glucuronate 4-epimerase
VYLAANGDPARSDREPAEDLRANAVSLVNVLDACRFGHLVFFSSGAVYDGLKGTVNPSRDVCPTLPYAISKFASERYAMHAKKQARAGVVTIARFFGAYGPYEAERKIYGRLVRQFAIASAPRYVLRGDGRNMIDAMYVDDTVRAILAILAKPGDTATVDLHSGAPMPLKDLVERAARRFGLEARIEYEGEVPEYNEFRSDDHAMRSRFGFAPAIDLDEGLGRFHDWMLRQGAARAS